MKVTLLTLLLSVLCLGKVDPPNYDFSLDELKIFSPFNKLEDIQKKYQNLSLIEDNGALKIYKTYHTQLRYKFPVLFQTKKGVVTDFYARLPAYFLHDVFHQSLINRYKMQDHYHKDQEQAVYIWKNRENIHHVYSGACSITCFPIYYAQYPEKHDFGAFTPIIKKLHQSYLDNFGSVKVPLEMKK
jgi:hypothetical protein